MTKAANLTPLAWFAAVMQLAGCASSPPAHAQAEPARRSNVVAPSISMAAARLDAAPGSRVALTAHVHGGEAMLFTVDWHVAEGAAGGSVAPGTRKPDGSYEAIYTAPPGGGTYHVTATIREFPSATAAVEVRVAPR